MLKFKTSCAVLAYLSSNLLNEVGLSLFRYFEIGLRVCDIFVKKFTFAISYHDEFLSTKIDIAKHESVTQKVSEICIPLEQELIKSSLFARSYTVWNLNSSSGPSELYNELH